MAEVLQCFQPTCSDAITQFQRYMHLACRPLQQPGELQTRLASFPVHSSALGMLRLVAHVSPSDRFSDFFC